MLQFQPAAKQFFVRLRFILNAISLLKRSRLLLKLTFVVARQLVEPVPIAVA